MPSIRSARPPEPVDGAAHTVVDEVLYVLVESGCKYLREHPEAKPRLGVGPAHAAELLAAMLDRDDDDDEAKS